LIPDASDLISTFLEGENDATCKRNAFSALASIDHDKALAYLSSVFDSVPNAEELLQLVELEFIRKDAVQNPQNKVCYTLHGQSSTYADNRRRDIYASFLTFSRLAHLPLFTRQRPR